MIRTFIVLLTLFFATHVKAQDKPVEIYDIKADAFKQIEDARKQAVSENKNILVQLGGNWCSWCRLFNKFSHENKTVDSLMKADFVTIHVNYSKENKNTAFLEKYDHPERFGFPVFLVLNSEGKLLHTQDSGYLEEGKGYSEEKVTRLLKLWNRFSTVKK